MANYQVCPFAFNGFQADFFLQIAHLSITVSTISQPEFIYCTQYISMVFSLNFQLNTKWFVPEVFLLPFIDGIAVAQTLTRRYATPPHFKL